jgi:hypothetical protein
MVHSITDFGKLIIVITGMAAMYIVQLKLFSCHIHVTLPVSRISVGSGVAVKLALLVDNRITCVRVVFLLCKWNFEKFY